MLVKCRDINDKEVWFNPANVCCMFDIETYVSAGATHWKCTLRMISGKELTLHALSLDVVNAIRAVLGDTPSVSVVHDDH